MKYPYSLVRKFIRQQSTKQKGNYKYKNNRRRNLVNILTKTNKKIRSAFI